MSPLDRLFQSPTGEMEVDVEDSPLSSPLKQNGTMVVEVAGPVVIQYSDKKNREKVRELSRHHGKCSTVSVKCY